MIPGLNRSVPDRTETPAQRPQRPTMSEKYGIPFGTYDVNGRRFRFKYDPQLFGTKVHEYVNGKWDWHVMPGDVSDAVATIKAETIPSETCTECGRPLSDHESVAQGMGETCIAKKAAEREWAMQDEPRDRG
ncbi:DUF6011 domain-containing protein [Nocardia ninae]